MIVKKFYVLVHCKISVYLADDGYSISIKDHSCGGLIGSCKVVEILAVLVLLCSKHLLILIKSYNQTLVRNRLHIIFIHVRGLVQSTLHKIFPLDRDMQTRCSTFTKLWIPIPALIKFFFQD